MGNNTTAIACAIYNSLYNEEEKPLAAKRLSAVFEENGFHINCGILGMKYLYTALSEYGYAQTAYKITVNPQQPSYAYWILNGMTTLCETWDMKKSCNHHMYSEVDMWFYKYLAGIQILEGAEAVCIRPCFIDEIKWVRAKHKGIQVYWDENILEIASDKPIILKMNHRTVNLDPGTHRVSRK